MAPIVGSCVSVEEEIDLQDGDQYRDRDQDIPSLRSCEDSRSVASSSGNSSNSNSNTRPPNFLNLVHHKWRKIWKRDSAEITPTDPSHKTIYLGNVVTTWAKGDGCLERPASALWKNHCQGRGSIKMLISVAPSGLKAQTREHGLTEYWANRLTWCGVPPDYPKLFCWIYRHEGRKLKQELRCHAVLCSKEVQAQRLAQCLKNRLTEALFDFKKEKLLRQNARLSLTQGLYNTSATKRKLVLMNSNSQNYKPPLERSKSAPKLSCIEEFEEEENEENCSPCHTHPQLGMSISAPIPEETFGGDRLELQPFEEIMDASNNKQSSPSPLHHRKSYPSHLHQVHPHPDKHRRPHTVPLDIDSRLNLPYMTGYDKVMHLLDLPSSESNSLLFEVDVDDEFPNSDPVASSPGSDASDLNSEEGHHRMRRESDENEINDNISDESGYSEDASPTISFKKSPGPATINSTPLVVYDNLCFEI